MPSTTVSRIDYDPQAQVLDVWFKASGEHYRYHDVPPLVYEAFRRASSKGRFLNAHVKERYPFQRMPAGPGKDGALLERLRLSVRQL